MPGTYAETWFPVLVQIFIAMAVAAGGGMAAPLTNLIWIYGNDDDTLFRLIALGTVEFQKRGYRRKGSEFVVGPMPPFGEVFKTDDDI